MTEEKYNGWSDSNEHLNGTWVHGYLSDNNFRKDLGYWIKLVDAEVVGNIFDNPELLEGCNE